MCKRKVEELAEPKVVKGQQGGGKPQNSPAQCAKHFPAQRPLGANPGSGTEPEMVKTGREGLISVPQNIR